MLLEATNLHMIHAEDLLVNGGVNGTREAINFFRGLRDLLSGSTKGSYNISVKWDGCIHKDTVLLTDRGDMTIHEIINLYQSGEKIRVMGRFLDDISYDMFTNVIGESVSEGNKEWVEVFLEDGSSIKMTEDHELHTSNRGWVTAGELREDDDITEL